MTSRNISRHLKTDYGVPLHGLKRKKLTDFTASRLDQMIFPEDEKGHKVYDDAAQSVIDGLQLQSRQRRDLALDFYNPREELPKDVAAERIIDQIPDFKPYMLDLSLPEDYKPHDQVRLVQDARANFIVQSNLFDNPETRIPGVGDGARGRSAEEFYSQDVSAAGLVTNRLKDEDGTPVGTVESMQAF